MPPLMMPSQAQSYTPTQPLLAMQSCSLAISSVHKIKEL